MRRILALLAIVGAGAAGCGGEERDDDRDVRTAVRAYLTAVAAGHGERACAQLTEAARREAVETVTAAFPDAGRVTCEEAVGDISADIAPIRKQTLLNPRIDRVTVDGDRATAIVRGLAEPTPLRRSGREWRIARSSVDG